MNRGLYHSQAVVLPALVLAMAATMSATGGAQTTVDINGNYSADASSGGGKWSTDASDWVGNDGAGHNPIDYRTAIRIPTSGIPAGATITAVTLRVVVTTASASHSLNCWSIENEPEAASGATIFADCANGTQFISGSTAFQTTGEKFLDVGAGGAVANLQTAVDGGQTWWAVGLASPSLRAILASVAGGGANVPFVRVTYTESAKDLTAVTVTQPNVDVIGQGMKKQEILRIAFNVSGSTGTLTLTDLTVTGQNTNDSDIASNGVRLYWTGSSSTFSTGTLLGTAQSLSGGTATFSTLGRSLNGGTNYAWIAYDVTNEATLGNTVDARIAQASHITVATDSTFSFSGDPALNRTISNTNVKIYVDDATDWTGYTTTTAKTDGDMDITETARRGYVKFNVADLNGATVSAASLFIYGNSTQAISTLANQIWPLANDPVSTAAGTLYTDCGDGTQPAANITWPGTIPRWYEWPLNATGFSQIQTAAGGVGWYGLGIKRGSTNWYIFDGHPKANRPYLQVTYDRIPITIATSGTSPANVNAGDTDTRIVTFSVSATQNTDRRITALTINETGTFDWATYASNVRLYEDTDNDYGNGGTTLLKTGTVSGESVPFSSFLVPTSTIGTTTFYLHLVMDIGGGSPDSTMNVNIASASSIALDGTANTNFNNTTFAVASGNISVTSATPKDLTDVSVTQASTADVTQNSDDNPILRLEFVVTGSTGTLTLNGLTVTSANLADTDIKTSGVKLHWTGGTPTFSANPIGTASFSGGTAAFTGLTQGLSGGSNYVWVTYDIAPGAMGGNTVDARINAAADITLTGDSGGFNLNTPNPDGSRTIYASTTKNWNGGGWNRRQVSLLGTEIAGDVIRIRLDATTTPTASTIWNEALGTTANAKANSVRIFRNQSGSWTEVDRNLFVFGTKRCYLDFALPAGHGAADIYYVASGGNLSASPVPYESLTDTFSDNFEAGLSGWTTSTPASTTFAANGNGTPIPQGTQTLEAVDGSSSSYTYGYKSIATAGRQIIRFWYRASGDETRVNAYTTAGGGNAVWAFGTLGGQFQIVRGQGGGAVLVPMSPTLSHTANQWYSVKIDVDDTADLMDIYVDGELYSPDSELAHTGTATHMYAQTIYAVGGESATSNLYVDDIRWSTYVATATHSLGSKTNGDGLWSTASNWEPVGLPTSTDHVVISGGSFNYQPTVDAGGACASLILGSSNTLTITAGTLSLFGSLNVQGTLSHTGGILHFTGASTKNIVGPSALTLVNLTLDGGSLDVRSSAITVSGTFALTSGTLDLRALTHNVQGDLTQDTGTITTSTHTLRATGSGSQNWTLSTLALNNLTVDKTSGTVTLSGNLNVTSSVTLPASNTGVLDLGGGTHGFNGANDTTSVVVDGGRLDISTSTTTTAARVNIGSAGTLRMEGNGKLRVPTSGIVVVGTLRAIASGNGRPEIRTSGTPGVNRFTFTFQDNATVDLYGLDVNSPNASGMEVLDADGSGFVRIDDVKFTNGDSAAGSSYLNFSALNSGSFTLRLNSFDASCPITVRLRAGFTDGMPDPLVPASSAQIKMENAQGARGDNDNTTGGGIAENFDGDPDGDVHITWVYFKRWIGSLNSIWSVAGNWQGGAAPINTGNGEDVLIDVGPNTPILDQNWVVKSLSMAAGSSFSLGSFTLTITGDTFQAFGATFDPGTGTVRLAGTLTQSINIGTNPLWNLILDKSGGNANLVTNLTVRNALRIIDGIFDLNGYALTVGAAGGTGLVYVNDERASGDVTTAVVSEADAAMPPGGSTPKDSNGSIVGGTTSTMTVLSEVRVRGDGVDRGLLSLSGSAVWTQNGSVNPSGSSNVAGKIALAGAVRLVMGDGLGTDILTIPSGGILDLNGGARLEMRTTGTPAQASIAGSFITTLSGSSKPTITSANGTNGFAFAVSGTVDVSGLQFSRGNDNGLDITSAATLTNLNSISFTSGSTNAGARHMRIVRSANGTFQSQGCSFDNSTSPPYYVTLDDGAATFTLFMSNATGAGVALNDANMAGSGREEEIGGATITWVDQRTWAGNWLYRRQITVSNGSASNLPAGAPVELTFNHQQLVTDGKSLLSGNDIRVVYWNGTTGRELDRVLFKRYNNDGWNTINCTIVFPTVNLIGPSPASDAGYFVYYGNLSAGSPPAGAANVGVVFLDGIESGNLTVGQWALSQDASGWDLALDPVGVHSTPVNSGANSMGSKRGTGTVRLYNRFKTGNFVAAGLSNIYIYYDRTTLDQSGPDQVGYESGYSIDGLAFVNWESVSSAGTTAWTPVTFSMPNTAVAFRLVALFGNSATVGNYSIFDDVRVYANHNGTLPGTTSFAAAAEQTITTANRWNDPFNWTPVGVPTANTAVKVDEATQAYQYPPYQDTGTAQQVLNLTIGDVTSGGLTLTNALTVTKDLTVDTAGSQTAVTLSSDLTVGGDIIFTEGTFAGAQTVRLNRASLQDQKIRGSGNPSFPNLATADASVRALIDTNTTVTGTLTIGSTGSTDEIEISTGKVLRVAGAGPHNIRGTLDIEPGGTLSLSTGSVAVLSGGTLEAVGTSNTNRAKIYDDTVANGGYSITVNEGATVNMNWYDFSEPGTAGLKLGTTGAGSVTITSLDNGWLHKPANSGVLLNTSQLNSWAGAFTGTISGCKFEAEGATTAAAVQGGTEATLHAAITMSTYVGDLATDELTGVNTDANNLIDWGTVVTPAIIDDASFAIAADASGGGKGIQVGDTVKVKFSASTNAPTVSGGAWLNTNLTVTGKTWGTIQSATWSTTDNANDTLTINLGTGSDIVVGNTIAMPAGGLIKDVTALNSATGTSTIKGTFGANTPVLVGAVVGKDQAGASTVISDPGPQSTETVILTFDKDCVLENATALTTSNIDSVLQLTNSHTWGTVSLIEYYTSTNSPVSGTSAFRKIKVTLGGTNATLKIEDSITIAALTIRDDTEVNNAVGSPPTLSGTFGKVKVVSAMASDPTPSAGLDNGDKIAIKFDQPTNQPALTEAQIKSLFSLAGTIPASPAWGDAALSASWTDSRTLDITVTTVDTGAPGGGAVIGAESDGQNTTIALSATPTTIDDKDTTTVYGSEDPAVAVAIAGTFGGAPIPTVVSVMAEDFSNTGAGIQQNDRIVITFDQSTDFENVIDTADGDASVAASIAKELPLSTGSTWGTLSAAPPGGGSPIRWLDNNKVLIIYLDTDANLSTGSTTVDATATDPAGRNRYIESASGTANNTTYSATAASKGWGVTIIGSFGAGAWTITVYQDTTEATPMEGVAVRMIKNGANLDVKFTNGGGQVNFGGPVAGDLLLVYRDSSEPGETTGEPDATHMGAVTIAGGNTGTLKLYRNILVVDNNNAGATTNANLAAAIGGAGDSEIPYSVDASNNLTLNAGISLRTIGSYTVQAGETVTIPNTQSVTVVGGTFKVVGSPTSVATLTVPTTTTDRFGMTVKNGATLRLEDFTISNLSATGLVVENGATLQAINYGTFTTGLTPAAGDVTLDLFAIAGANRSKVPYSLLEVTFTAADGKNIKTGKGTPMVAVSGAGTRWGSAYESDEAGRITWDANPVDNVTDSLPFASFRAAVRAGTTAAGESLRAKVRWPFNESLDLNNGGAPKAVILENAILYPMSGNAVGNSDNILRGTLRNCIVLKGGIDFVTLQNCTVFDPDSAAAPVTTSSAATNTLFEEAAPGLPSGDTTNLKGVASTLFVDSTQLDFHLVSQALTGSATFTSTSTTVTGTGFDTQLVVGDGIRLDSDGTWYEVAAIAGATSLTLASAYSGTTATGTSTRMNRAVDRGTNIAAVTVDIDGHSRPQNVILGDQTPVGNDLDIGADEFVAKPFGGMSTTPDAQTATNLGDIAQHWNIFRGSSRFIYAVTRGGSAGGLRDNMLLLLRRDTLAEVARYTAPGPIHGMIYSVVDGSGADTEIRIFLLIDTDNDGFADGIQALIDTIDSANLPADVDFHYATDFTNPVAAQTDIDGGAWYQAGKIYVDRSFDRDGNVNDGGVTGAYVNRLPTAKGADALWHTADDTYASGGRLGDLIFRRIGSEGEGGEPAVAHDRLRWSKRILVVRNNIFYKINADALDYSDPEGANRVYGRTIWTSDENGDGTPDAGRAPYQWRGPIVALSGSGKMYIPVTDDATDSWLVAMMDWIGNTPPAGDSGWAIDASNRPNRYGHSIKLNGAAAAQNTFIHVASSGGNRMAAFRANATLTANFWVTDATGADALPAPIASMPLRPLPVDTKYAFVAAADRIEKVYDDSITDPSPATNGKRAWAGGSGDTDGDLTAGYGAISSNLDYVTTGTFTRLGWGTARGYAQAMRLNLTAAPVSGDEFLEPGWPYSVAGDEVVQVFMSYESGGIWSIMYITKGGRILKFRTQ